METQTPLVHIKWADEKSLVGASATLYNDSDTCVISDHPALSIINIEQKNPSADEVKQELSLTNQDYMAKIMEVNDKLDMVKDIVRPGCSYEVLNTALRCMSSLATILSKTPQKIHASL